MLRAMYACTSTVQKIANGCSGIHYSLLCDISIEIEVYLAVVTKHHKRSTGFSASDDSGVDPLHVASV